jgi:hypothetical protein
MVCYDTILSTMLKCIELDVSRAEGRKSSLEGICMDIGVVSLEPSVHTNTRT